MEARKTIRKYIRVLLESLLEENIQMADKVYFKPGKLSNKIREIIVSKITGGDNYTKIITDFYWAMLQQSIKQGKWLASFLDDQKEDKDSPEEKEESVDAENDMLSLEQWKELKQLYFDLK